MDPLTLATGAASLAVTAAKVSHSLHEIVDGSRSKPDSPILNLSDESVKLSGFLENVDKVLRECHVQALTLPHIDDTLWGPVGNTMMDCKATLEALDNLTGIIKGGSLARNIIFRRGGMVARIEQHTREISGFLNKMYQSGCAMKTVLAVVKISLSFRSTSDVSQETLFRELGELRKLLDHSLVVASDPGFKSDPFAAQISRNLQTLVKAAQRFHSNASTTASTRYGGVLSVNHSAWGGSEAGDLSDFQRERIVTWNQLQPVQEEGSHIDDASTGRSATTAQQAPPATTEDEDTDTDTDVELDFLKNFDELAETSFVNKDYAKAEQFLRKAIERSTGETDRNANFKVLKIRLALCCCYQDNWNAAESVLSTMTKSKSPEDLPVFHILHAVSFAYFEDGRLEEALGACKLALQGRKRLLGKTSGEYYESLSLLGDIYDKKGDSIEAEAVRHSLPKGKGTSEFSSLEDQAMTARYYLLKNQQLAQLMSRESVAPEATKLSNPDSSPTTIAFSPALTPKPEYGQPLEFETSSFQSEENIPVLTAVERQVGELDTGKELVYVKSASDLIGATVGAPDQPNEQAFGRSDTDKELVSLLDPKLLQRPSSTPSFQAEGLKKLFHGLENMQLRNTSATELDMVSSRNVSSVILTSTPGQEIWRHLSPTPRSNNERETVAPPSTRKWGVDGIESGQQMPSSGETEEPISVKIPRMGIGTLQTLGANIALGMHLSVDGVYITGITWTGELRFYMAVEPSSRSLERPQWQSSWVTKSPTTPPNPQTPPTASWSDYVQSILRMLECDSAKSRDAKPSRRLNAAMEVFGNCIADLEQQVRQCIDEATESGLLDQNTIGPTTVAVPAKLVIPYSNYLRTAQVLGHSSLLKNQSLMSQHLCILLSFLHRGLIFLDPPICRSIVVLHCGGVLVESVTYQIDSLNLDEDISVTQAGKPTAGFFGSIHIEAAFIDLVRDQIKDATRPLKTKLGSTIMDTLIRSCCSHFCEHILYSFNNDGREWTIDVELPLGFPGIPQAKLRFSNDDILACFEPTIRRIKKVMKAAILGVGESDVPITHVALAGKFASSPLIQQTLDLALSELEMGISLLLDDRCAFTAATGALYWM